MILDEQVASDNPLKLTEQRSLAEVDSTGKFGPWGREKTAHGRRGGWFVDESNLYLGFSKEVLFPLGWVRLLDI